jgi:microcompartment protein CcmL/EutN
MQALGFVEISGVTAAVDALDIMCKAADVEFVTWERKLGGRLVTIIVTGSISAVTAAVENAAKMAIKKPVATAVIARPHEETCRLVELSASRLQKKAEPKQTAEQQ